MLWPARPFELWAIHDAVFISQARPSATSPSSPAAADHLIDMGPVGGRILAAGTPGDVASDTGNVTGPWLAEYLSLLAI